MTEGIVASYEQWIFEDLTRAKQSAVSFELQVLFEKEEAAFKALDENPDILKALHPLFSDVAWSPIKRHEGIPYLFKAKKGSAAFLLYDESDNVAYLLQGGVGL